MTTKTRKIKPPFKTDGGKYQISSWIIEKFPPEYQNLTYIEPYAGACSILLNKERSELECVGENDVGVVQILRALRDEPTMFCGRLKRTKYRVERFDKALKFADKEFDDYLDHAINEFILRRMSRGGNKRSFNTQGEQSWENTLYNELPLIADRIGEVHIFQKTALDVIKAFNDHDIFCYCDPPPLTDEEENVNEHVKLAEKLRAFKGKVLISSTASRMYRREYEGWKCSRKKHGQHMEYVWMNY